MKKLFTSFLLIILSVIPSLHAQLSSHDAVMQMQKGINLGNTLEPPLEGGWNNPAAQEYYFDLYKEAGFSCIRIPVRWDEHTQKDFPYLIDEEWLQRVEEILDWGLQRDLIIIINAHHDDWIKQNYSNAAYRERFDSIWSQISVRFRYKSEKLIFEVLNEPYGLTKIQNDDMHQRVLSIIRKTNPTRNVIFQGHNWGGSDELIASAIPDDEHVIGSFHSYDPYTFGLLGEGTWGTAGDIAALDNKFAGVKNWSDQNNVPVILGEFGSLRSCDYNSRMKHYAEYVKLSQKYGFASCAWDDGGDFRILERADRKWDEVKDILIHTTANSPANLALKVLHDTAVQLNWTNKISGQDSLVIYRRTTTTTYSRIATLKGDSSSYLDFNPLPLKYNHYRIISYFNSGEMLYSCPARIYMPAYQRKVRTSYFGQPAMIPGIVEAENFDFGGEGLAYHDSDPGNIAGDYRPEESVDIYSRLGDGFHIGNAVPGEWYEYTVNVENEGMYRINSYLAALTGGGKFKLKIGNAESGLISVPASNSWLATKQVSDSLLLKSGDQIMRFSVMALPMFNIDKFEFIRAEVPAHMASDVVSPLTVFLNRNRDIVYDLKDENIKRIQLYNITGAVIYTSTNPENRREISTAGIRSGIYIFQMTTEKASYSVKIILP